MAPFCFKGITEWTVWLGRNTLAQFPLHVLDTPPQPHMLFQCKAEISTSQICNPKSTISRG